MSLAFFACQCDWETLKDFETLLPKDRFPHFCARRLICLFDIKGLHPSVISVEERSGRTTQGNTDG